MIRTMALSLGLSLSMISAADAQETAQDDALKTLTTADETRGWNAVGRLNLGDSGFCTGALITPNHVLTAAHCLFDKKTGLAYEPAEIEFLAGWRNGRAAAYRGVRRAIPHPEYRYEGPENIDRVAYDLAVLELDQAIRLPSIQPFQTAHVPAQGDSVGVVSYALDRSEAPSLQENCHVLERQTGILVLSCDVNFGSSGAPIFSLAGGQPRIVSVVSAKAEMGDDEVALGTAMEEPLAELLALVEDDASGYRRAKPVPNASTPRIVGLGSAGAKFVKP